ncbi:DUF397 domain-containing protein [Actinomadura sp. BRA 177]|uniref:DUF397 domain-containing protein n=1 Tax=Actinomadura sp. BRA 177 TaxID=2745202 RepID=UPI0015958CBC|nr:DUF397 domain-containing protein [Actinomadura sp. BRA 177]NVI86317.1 DUF397 domain-containing protein [Actinomadura sp. BRA 177]
MSTHESGNPLGQEDRSRIAWHISSFSPNGGGNCVEAGPLADGTERVAVRHSHRPNAEVIIYTRPEWEAFLNGVRNGEFNFFA